jgi:signal transduction histidine kinase
MLLTARPALGQPSETAVKAAFLPRFARYVTWPPPARPGGAQPFQLCVIGVDPFGRALDQAAAGQGVDGHAVTVRRLSSASGAAGCHVAFVQGANGQATGQLLAGLSRLPVLTVTDARSGSQRGMVHFLGRQRAGALLHRRCRGGGARAVDQLATAVTGRRRTAAARMRVVPRLGEKWRSGPVAIFAIALFLLLAGMGIILQNEGNYREIKDEETRVQARILAATVAAALDFDDPQAAQEAVDAFRVNRQVRWIGIFDEQGAAVAGYRPAGQLAPARQTAVTPASESSIRAVVPIESAGNRTGTVYFEVDREPLSRRLTRYLLLGFLVTLAALVVIVLGLAQTALRRANGALADRAEALAEANALLEVQMEERAKAEEQLRQAQKMQALGQLTGGIAHDFNNLLTVIQGSADMLCRDNLPDPKRLRFAQAIVQASGSAAALTSQLLAFARRQPLKPEPLNLNALVEGMRDLIDRTLGERIEVKTALTSQACITLADRNQLEAAILNIAANARDAMLDGGCLSIATRIDSGGEKPMVGLEITDTGTGMDQDTLEHIFEPFFTTKKTGKGTGLGLSQVYGFAQQSGGEVRATSKLGVGRPSRFSCLVPRPQRTWLPAMSRQDTRSSHPRPSWLSRTMRKWVPLPRPC